MHDAQIALPDGGDAIEDGNEEPALRQDPGREEVPVADRPGGDAADAAEHLPEHQQPQHGLDGARQQLQGIMAQLAGLGFHHCQRVAHEIHKRICVNRDGGPYGAFGQHPCSLPLRRFRSR